MGKSVPRKYLSSQNREIKEEPAKTAEWKFQNFWHCETDKNGYLGRWRKCNLITTKTMFLKWYLKASHNLGIFYVLLKSILTIVTTNKSCKSVLLAMSMK